MKQYLLNVIEPAHEPGDVPSGEMMEEIIRNVNAINEEMQSAGVWVFGSALAHPSTATVVRVQDGEVLMTDGPFTEGKEHIGGFTIIQADDLDAALEWGRKVTLAIGLPIEVRPFEGVH